LAMALEILQLRKDGRFVTICGLEESLHQAWNG